MGSQLELPDAAWRVTNWSWIAFFAVMGVLNLWVAFNFDTDTWVNFKLFGGLGLMVVFVIGQALYLGPLHEGRRSAANSMSHRHHRRGLERRCRNSWRRAARSAGRKRRPRRPCRGRRQRYGTHFRVRIASPCSPASPAWRGIALCMMRCKISSTGAARPRDRDTLTTSSLPVLR